MNSAASLIKDIYTYTRNEIRSRINSKKDFQASSIPTHDPNYMYDIYTREFSGVKARNILEYFDWARRGVPFYFYKYFDTISKRDTRIRTMTRKLKAAILTEQFRVSGEWEEGIIFCEDVIKYLGPRLYKFFTDSIEANIKGIKRFEVNFEIDGGKWMPHHVKAIPNFLYLYNEKTSEYSFLDTTKINQTNLISALTAEPDKFDMSRFPTVETNPVKIIDVLAIDGDEDNGFLNGITIALLFAYYCKSYNIKDMNIFLERFASPTTKMKYDPLNEKSRGEMINAAKDMRAHGTIIYPDGTDIDLLSDAQKGQAGNLYLSAIEYWNSEITILFAGEEETTQMGNKGSMAALQVKKKISELIIEMNLRTCANAFNELLQRLIDINFPNPPEYPVFEYIKIATLDEKKTQSEINLNLKNIGVRPTLEELEEQFDVELEEVAPAESKDEDSNPEENEDEDNPDEYENDFLKNLFEQSERRHT